MKPDTPEEDQVVDEINRIYQAHPDLSGRTALIRLALRRGQEIGRLEYRARHLQMVVPMNPFTHKKPMETKEEEPVPFFFRHPTFGSFMGIVVLIALGYALGLMTVR
jgi:hypothetical protein